MQTAHEAQDHDHEETGPEVHEATSGDRGGRAENAGRRKDSTQAQGQDTQPSPTLREAADNYLQKRRRKVESEELSRRTFNTDRRSLDLLLTWMDSAHGEVGVQEAAEIGLRGFKESRLRSVSPTTAAKNLRHIKSFFSDLKRRGVVTFNPAKRLDIPKSRRRDIIPTRTEFKALKDWLDEQIEDSDRPAWIHLLMRLACSTGMRLGELIQIKWERGPEDIGTGHARNYVYLDREEKTLTIKFKRKLRVIPASHVWGVFETLRKRRKEARAYVFASPNGGHYDDSYVCRLWKKETEKAKQEGVLGRAYTCHSIRHAVVTSLLRKDYSAHKVGQLVGHSSEQITERYAHLVASDLNEMVVDLSD